MDFPSVVSGGLFSALEDEGRKKAGSVRVWDFSEAPPGGSRRPYTQG